MELTQAELGIWLGHQSASDPSVYTACDCIFLSGDSLTQERLQTALERTLRSAPQLYARYREQAGQPIREDVVDAAPPSLQFLDFSQKTDPRAAALQFAEAQTHQHLRIEQGDLCRHFYLQLGPGKAAWVHLAHHLALDGYGFSLITRRVTEEYARLEGEELSLTQFGDLQAVLDADQSYQTSSAHQKDGEFFAELLAGTSGIQWGPKERAPIAHALRASALLDADAANSLRACANSLRLRWTDILLATSARFIAELSGVRDFSLGLPAMLRLGSPSATVPCMAMNILALPVQVRAEQSLVEASRELGFRYLKAKRHGRVRYEELSKLVGPQKHFGPIFNLMPFDTPLQMGSVAVESVSISAGPVQDLSLGVIARGEALELVVDLHPELSEEGARGAERVAARFRSSLLAAVVELEQATAADATSTQTLAGAGRELAGARGALATAAGKLAGAGGELAGAGGAPATKTPASGYAPFAAFSAVAEHAKTSSSLALVDGELSWTYQELLQAAAGAAQWLKAEGFSRGMVLGLELRPSAAGIALLVAASALGLVVLPLDAKIPQARRESMLASTEPHLVLSAGSSATDSSDFEATLAQKFLRLGDEVGAEVHGELSSQMPRTDESAYLIYTSGSTGKPKGVEMTYGGIAAFVIAASERYDFQASDSVLQFAPWTFDASIEEIFCTLHVGATLIIKQEAWLDSLQDLLNASEQVTILDLPTALFHEIALGMGQGTLHFPQGIRTLIIGGEAAQSERVADFFKANTKTRLINSYGPSEATVVTLTADLTPESLHAAENLSIGTPLPGVEAHLLNDAGALLAGEAEGQLALAGPTLARGYFKDAAQTAARFLPYLEEGRLYLTGDRVRRIADGSFQFVGRIDDEFKLSGHRVIPSEIEGVLAAHPQVSQAIALGRQQGAHRHLVAHVECKLDDEAKRASGSNAAAQLSPESLRAFARESLPEALLPRIIYLHDSFPKNAHGKVDRKALEAKVNPSTDERAEQVSLSVSEEEQDPTLAALRRVWEEVLGHHEFGLDDDFFSMGGSSLGVLQLAARLSDKKELRAAELFAAPTLRQQWQLLLGQTEGSSAQGLAALESAPPVTLPADFAVSPPEEIEGPILLTGATGFLGRELLQTLLEQGSQVLCLVRADNVRAAQERLLGKLEGAAAGLVHRSLKEGSLLCHAVDLSETHAHELRELLPPCSAVIHAAAQVSLTRGVASLQRDNVLPTRELLVLAAAWGAHFHYVSSIAIVPTTGAHEENFVAAHAGLADGYQVSKWQAEDLCRKAAEQGLQVSISRLGRIAGSSSTPSINPSDIFWRITRAALRSGYRPELPVSEPWIAADLAAQAIAQIAGSSRSQGVYHLTHQRAIKWTELHERIASAQVELKPLPMPAWLEKVAASADAEDQATLAFFQQQSEKKIEQVHYASTRTQAALGLKQELPWAPELLQAYVDCALQTFLPTR